jgi:hypothetical protein
MKAKTPDFELMSEQLRKEIRAAVHNGDLLFVPSPEVRSEAIRFIKPRSEALTFVNIDHGSGNGRQGDGKMIGIGMSPKLVDHIRETGFASVREFLQPTE